MLLRRWPVSALCLSLILLIFLSCLARTSWAGDGFQPVVPEELKLTSEPLTPGAPAVILDRQVDRDDSVRGDAHEYNYRRIKILTEEGRKYADVEIAFLKGFTDVVHINGRTIKPDGSIVNFDGKVYEKTLAKNRRTGFGVIAKTFALPNVEVGSIIEYYYTIDFKYVNSSVWIVSDDLFTKHAQFSLKPFKGNGFINVGLRWTWQGVPGGVTPKEGPDHIIRMEVSNISPFQSEDHMPPENELKARVDFIYETEITSYDPDKFWQGVGKRWNGRLESFIDRRKAMEQAVAQIVSPSDPPEVKLHKIYDRVQEIRNKTYEVHKTEEEEKRDKEKADLNVEDVWKRGYADGVQLTWLYLALVRAAGMEAYGCWAPSRKEYFFNPKMMQSARLNSNLVLVKLNGKNLFFDPGAEFTPYGMLTWSETGVTALCLNSDGGSWQQTTIPLSSESRIERSGKLTLSETGDLEGKLVVKYTGLEAMYYRLEMRHSDDVARKKVLEEGAVGPIPVAAQAELTNKPDWTSSEAPLIAEFDLKIPGWASNAGKRAMIPAGIFTEHEKHTFEHTNRVYPIYFEYPYEKLDDITIELPPGWQVVSVPASQSKDGHVIGYDMKVEQDKNSLHLTRKLVIDILLLDQKYYTALRNFFEVIRTTDDEQIVLQPGTSTASN
jgi:hypothetical protein